MPYKAKGKCVYKKDTGKKVGCTNGPVSKYLAALHANVPDAKNEEIEKPMKIKLSEIAKKIIKENRSTPLMLNGKEVDQNSIEIDGVDRRDYPDFSDAYISAASYVDGTPLSDKEIEELDAQNNELVHEKIQDDELYMQEGEASKQEEPSSQQQKNRFEWENDPYHSRRFEKSDVSWREYDMDMNPQNYRVKEGEEEKLGSSAYDREDREEKAARGKKATCRVCHKPFTPSYGEHSRCPSCMSKQHSSGEKATGTQ